MSTVHATDALLSRRELIAWFDNWHPYPQPGPDDDFLCAAEFAAQEQALLVAGTVCLHYGQLDLWKAIYSVAQPGGHHADQALEWLAAKTAAARRGEL